MSKYNHYYFISASHNTQGQRAADTSEVIPYLFIVYYTTAQRYIQ